MARPISLFGAMVAALVLLAGCREAATGPIRVSAIGGPPQLVNPNLQPLDPASAFLLEAAAQGLVRFDAAGEIEPALAQSWIVSDDGRRYTFRIRRTEWADGSRVTAEQVAARLRAAVSRASRNSLKPVLGAIENVVAMTDQVLEISLRGPRPNLLQLLAQPDMAIILNSRGTGPYRIDAAEDGAVRLSPKPLDDEESSFPESSDILVRGEAPALAVARFAEGRLELVTGGTIGNLLIARAANLPNNRLVFDRVPGLFGLAFATAEGPFADVDLRTAMSMTIDRQALVMALNVQGLEPHFGLVPGVVDELNPPAVPAWVALPLPARRQRAARTVAALAEPLRVRVAMPSGPGYRLVFAYLRRDWRMIGIEAQSVDLGTPAELRLIDAVAPAMLSTWYLRHFSCDASRICDPGADQALLAARMAATPAERRVQLVNADQAMVAAVPFIALTSPVRWSLVSPRLTGFRANPFARHPPGTLIAPES
jgi:oligopeptide transport system substrate-binding protein